MQPESQSISHHSRFQQRWLAADPARAGQLAAMAASSMATLDLDAALAAEMAALPLGRAMRRLRNALIATLIERDLSGTSDTASNAAARLIRGPPRRPPS